MIFYLRFLSLTINIGATLTELPVVFNMNIKGGPSILW